MTTSTPTEFNLTPYIVGFDNWDNDEFDCPYQMDTPEMVSFRLGMRAGEEAHVARMRSIYDRMDEHDAERFAGGAY